MYSITKLKTLAQNITQAIPAITGGSLVVIDEKNAVNQIKDKSKVVLMATVPSAEAKGALYRRRNVNAILLFVLEKANTGNPVDQLETLQPIALQVQTHMENLAETDCDFQYFEAGEVSIEPVHRDFGGYNGWMITIVF